MSLLKRLITDLRDGKLRSVPSEENRSTTDASGVATLKFEDTLIRFIAANKLIDWRVRHFYSKEPDTVAWLCRMPRNSTLLDVGANIGIYTLAAAIGRNCRVIAFEPESQNYANLNANIALNGASSQITAYCAALSDTNGLDQLFLSSFQKDGGTSCHSFGEEVGFDLSPRNSPYAQGCIGLRLDDLVDQGKIPVPDFIKIDVDGFEHKVIEGALKTLKNPKVKELLIEVNPAIEQHREMIATLWKLGFYYDLDQSYRAKRKDGPFKNVGEVIFRRIADTKFRVMLASQPENCTTNAAEQDGSEEHLLDHVLNRIRNTAVTEEPFPYIVVDDFFPRDYYNKALANFPRDEQMIPLSETGRSDYKDRLVVLFSDEHFSRLDEARRNFWRGFSGWLYSEKFIDGLIEKFMPYVACRLADLDRGQGVRLHGDALIVSDKTNYAIGPHTDAPHRLITFLFYLPGDDTQADLGTSIYRPFDESTEFSGRHHHPFHQFERLKTVEFLPNRALIFVRNGHSFHGVEPITRADVIRHLVINNIRIADC